MHWHRRSYEEEDTNDHDKRSEKAQENTITFSGKVSDLTWGYIMAQEAIQTQRFRSVYLLLALSQSPSSVYLAAHLLLP